MLDTERSCQVVRGRQKSAPEKVTQGLVHDRAAYLRNGRCERDILGADLDAVLSVAAFLDAAIAHQGRQALALQFLARGMHVEQPCLRDGRGAHEARILVELRASFHAAATRNTAGNGISLFLLLRRNARAGTEIVRAIDWNPGLDGFEVLEEYAAVGSQVADDGELGKW